MTSAVLLQVLGSVLGSTVLVSLLTAYISRRKLGAEATEIITQAATGVLEQFKADNVRLREENRTLDAKIDTIEDRVYELERMERSYRQDMVAVRETAQHHAAWDFAMITRLEELGVPREEVRPPPPLLPPHLLVPAA